MTDQEKLREITLLDKMEEKKCDCTCKNAEEATRCDKNCNEGWANGINNALKETLKF